MSKIHLYTRTNGARRWPKRVIMVLVVLLVLLAASMFVVQRVYNQNLQPVSSSKTSKNIVIQMGSSDADIANQLYKDGLIRKSWAFQWYVRSHDLRSKLQAGTYAFSPSQSTPQIVDMIVNGKIVKNLIIILPGQRLSQVKQAFLAAKFNPTAVEQAFDPTQYAGSPALADKPAGANLEGFLYPDSFQKDATTDPKVIVQESLDEMEQHLTPDIRASFAAEGLSVYQGVTLASIVEQEVSKPADRSQAAQVFLTRLKQDMPLGSDVTAFYGARLAGRSPSTTYDSSYNTLIHKGLPPGPISNVSDSSLQAVAHPAPTDWLYFVAGDDGTTYFSKTLEEHQALTQQHCHKLCNATQ